MKKLITTFIAVFALSTVLFAQGRVVKTDLQKDLNKNALEYNNFLLKAPSNLLKSISENITLAPPAFTMGCFDPETEGKGLTVPSGGVTIEGEVYPVYFTGNNIYGDTRYGQIFKQSIEDKAVVSVDVYLANLAQEGVRQIYAHIYELDANDLPSKLLGTSQAVLTSAIAVDNYFHLTTFNFASPISVSGNFAVVLDLPELEAGSALIIIGTSPMGCYGTGHENYAVLSYENENGNTVWEGIFESYGYESSAELQEDGFDYFELAVFVNLAENDGTSSLQSIGSANYTIYPNPATDVIYIENAADSKVRMIDATGKVVVERTVQNAKENIEINHLEKGVYFMEVTGKEGKSVNKIIKR